MIFSALKIALQVIILLICSSIIIPVSAVEDPRTLPNNKVGIHILFPDELKDAARLVNDNGGDYGYVVIPIQASDKDLEKWQEFMDSARKHHIIPIVRIATESDYFNTKLWRKPTEYDIIDFTNFLNSLEWPTKNRYVIIFNEVNRDDEWGGSADPSEYARLLRFAVNVFKSTSEDFFIISAGLDNASINGNGAINPYTFLTRMNDALPGIFCQIDGLGSHSYPNPAFSQPPSKQDRVSIATFRYEKALVKRFCNNDLPVFITETGWKNSVSSELRAIYYQQAFATVWSDPGVVMVAPFLLKASNGPFTEFSFLGQNGLQSAHFLAVANMPKTAGAPSLNAKSPSPQTEIQYPTVIRSFENSQPRSHTITINSSIILLVKWLLKV